MEMNDSKKMTEGFNNCDLTEMQIVAKRKWQKKTLIKSLIEVQRKRKVIKLGVYIIIVLILILFMLLVIYGLRKLTE